MSTSSVINLPKGGIIIDTSAGALQIGSPPETIKDSMLMKRDVPDIYIAPRHLFSYTRMLSLMDVEFPCNYNFFIQKKKTKILCTREQLSIIKGILKEALIGPDHLNIDLEYITGSANPYFPNMEKEMIYFRKHPATGGLFSVDDVVEWVILDDLSPVRLDTIEILLDKAKAQVTIKDGAKEHILPWEIEYPDDDIGNKIYTDIFIPPSFGITTLGSSHGFDPKGKTSGFVFWINGVGVMVDPPVDSALWLLEQNVSPKMVNAVILTHCHSDHDSGVMQKLLLEGRITLYTTPTIFSSFVRKIALLTGLHEINIIELIDFIPVMIHKPININGAIVTFSYRLHSIPTIGFEINFKGKSVVYTSDHLNDQEFFETLRNAGVLTEGRYLELSGFDWKKNIIIHEAGVPPLHTPVDTLLNLPEEYKKHIYLVHTDKDKIPENSGLKISPTGLANTMIIDPVPTVHGESIEVLHLISHLEIFEDVPLKKVSELLGIIKYLKFKAGDYLIKQGELNNRFFIIIAGKAKVIENGIDKAYLTSGSYFGEHSLMQTSPALSTIVAVTDLVTVTIEKENFLTFISNLNVFERLKKLSDNRKRGSWETINANRYFSALTINQKNDLEIILDEGKADENEIVSISSLLLEYAYLWNTGTGLILDQSGNVMKELHKGDFVGNPRYLLADIKQDFTIVAKSEATFFKITWRDFLKFLQHNPRLMFEIRNDEL